LDDLVNDRAYAHVQCSPAVLTASLVMKLPIARVLDESPKVLDVYDVWFNRFNYPRGLGESIPPIYIEVEYGRA
jgi:hypothetical protein